jgi:hypothetical protein
MTREEGYPAWTSLARLGRLEQDGVQGKLPANTKLYVFEQSTAPGSHVRFFQYVDAGRRCMDAQEPAKDAFSWMSAWACLVQKPGKSAPALPTHTMKRFFGELSLGKKTPGYVPSRKRKSRTG